MRDRIPPQNLEAEMAVLGAMMVSRELVPTVTSIVTVGDFYAPAHAPIFTAIAHLFDAGQPTDVLCVASELGRIKRLENCGGFSYLNSLMESVQTASSAEYYATLVAEKAVLRRAIAAGHRIIDLGFDGEADPKEAVAAMERELSRAILRSDAGSEITLETAVRDVWSAIDSAMDRNERPGYTSPWTRLDELTGRTFGGEMVAWGAAPQAGKSIATAQLALHLAQRYGQVAYFPLEMGVRDTVRRMLARESSISSRRLRLADIRAHEFERLGEAIPRLAQLPITFFDRSPRKGTGDVRRAIARMSTKAPVVACVIDHANFLSDAMSGGRQSKHERLDFVYQELLHIAAEFDCVMHVVQHLNRDGMQGRPTLAHLRDGGNLEGHAHIVVFPYRPNIEQDPALGEFIVAKNRDGEVAKIDMTFDGPHLEWRVNDPVAA